jgi:tRNA (guanine37-N1)-methyltransferase
MVICVVVDIEDAEETRKHLSSINIISDNYEIETHSGRAYIPVKSKVDGYRTEDVENLPSKDKDKTVENILGYNPTYEWIGDIVVLDVKESCQEEVVEAFKSSVHNPKSILNKNSPISGVTRVADYDVLYGNNTQTISREYGYEYKLDISCTYFTPRLAEERQRVASKVQKDSNTFDMFAGVGPYSIPCADLGGQVVATDINSSAIEFLNKNSRINNVQDSIRSYERDVRKVKDEFLDWADIVVMNLPHTSDEYIESATEICKDGGKIFYYCFLSEDESVSSETEKISSDISGRLEVDSVERVRSYAPRVDNACIEYNYREF